VDEKPDRTLVGHPARQAHRACATVQRRDDLPSAAAQGPDAQKCRCSRPSRTARDVVERRADFAKEVAVIPPKQLIFVDESGSHIGMTRDRARAPRGERVTARVPRNRGTVTTMIGPCRSPA
jgi:hypothetical protein